MTDTAKRHAASAALEKVKNGQILGLGSGSTVNIFLDLLGEKVRSGLDIVGVPTSEATASRARALNIPLSDLDTHPQLDLAIDGADEFDADLNLIKGGGGALLREKIVATCARDFVVIADSGKEVVALGHFPLPVEVIPMAVTPIKQRIAAHGRDVTLRRHADGRPFVTDEGNHILDCAFRRISNVMVLSDTLSKQAGIVEHGLFVGLASTVFIGNDTGVRVLEG